MLDKPCFFEQVRQLDSVIIMQRMMIHFSIEFLGQGAAFLGNISENMRKFTFHLHVTDVDRLSWFSREVLHLGQAEFGCSQQ